MKRIIAVGALSALTITLLFAGGPVASLAQTSPLPTPDAAMLALEAQTEAAIVAAAPHLTPSLALRDAARGKAVALIAARRCRDAMTLDGLVEVLAVAGYHNAAPAGWQIICGFHEPAHIAQGLHLGAPGLLSAAMSDVGVGWAHDGDQWRTVVVVATEPETAQIAAPVADLVQRVYIPAVHQ